MNRFALLCSGLTAALLVQGCASAPSLPEPPPPRAVPVEPPTGPVEAGSRISKAVPLDTTSVDPAVLDEAEGEASYYASRFDGRRTASGVVFRNSEPWAAHRRYPFGTLVRVTNLRNGRSVVLRIVDRGPFGKAHRIIDVSQSAARELDFIAAGRIPVRVEVLEWGGGKE